MVITLPTDTTHLWYYVLFGYIGLCFFKHMIDVGRLKHYNKVATGLIKIPGGDRMRKPHISYDRMIPLFFYNMIVCIPIYLVVKLGLQTVFSLILSITTVGFRVVRIPLTFWVQPRWYDENMLAENDFKDYEYC